MNVLRFLIAASLACLVVLSAAAQGNKKTKTPKLDVEEILAKHIASIGTPEALAAARSRVLIGSTILSRKSRANDKAGVPKVSGTAQFASFGEMSLFAIVFQSNAITREQFAYDGDKVTFSFPGEIATDLKDLAKSHSWVIKDGLFAGTLSSGWILLNSKAVMARLQNAGVEKLAGRDCYKIKYTPITGDYEPRVIIYIDAENFHHLQTEYEYRSSVATPPELGNLRLSYSFLSTWTEKFSDFRKEGELVLPHDYALNAAVAADMTKPESTQWDIVFQTFYFDQVLEPSLFRFS